MTKARNSGRRLNLSRARVSSVITIGRRSYSAIHGLVSSEAEHRSSWRPDRASTTSYLRSCQQHRNSPIHIVNLLQHPSRNLNSVRDEQLGGWAGLVVEQFVGGFQVAGEQDQRWNQQHGVW